MTFHKLKICFSCKKLKYIWKSVGKNKFCKICWSKQSPITKNKSKPKRISPRSEKRIIADKKYSKLRLKLLDKYPNCQAQISGVCSGLSTQCHHKAGRVGKLYTDYSKFLAVCHNCHNWIEIHVIEAKELGFSLNRL
jgi:hypothetical protein